VGTTFGRHLAARRVPPLWGQREREYGVCGETGKESAVMAPRERVQSSKE